MQKIMFNDKYGLTDAVLKGRKRMTRREPIFGTVSKPNYGFYSEGANKGKLALCDGVRIIHTSYYRMNEIVAVAQSYKDTTDCLPHGAFSIDAFAEQKGWSNKMFVKPDFMPHQIRITGIKVNRLQDISDEDCLKEGIYKDVEDGCVIGFPFGVPFFYTFYGAISKETGRLLHWTTPREAFSVLIDKVSGKGTWKANPWVFAYEFELVR